MENLSVDKYLLSQLLSLIMTYSWPHKQIICPLIENQFEIQKYISFVLLEKKNEKKLIDKHNYYSILNLPFLSICFEVYIQCISKPVR